VRLESISVYMSVVPLPVMVRTPVVVLNCRMERRDRGRQGGREGRSEMMGRRIGGRRSRERRREGREKEEEDRRGGRYRWAGGREKRGRGGRIWRGKRVGELNGGVDQTSSVNILQ